MTERIIKRGDIYRVVLDPTLGKEIRKTRRCVIISNNQQNQYSKDRKILTDQIRSVDRKRLREYKGQVGYETLVKIEKALSVVLALRKELPGFSDLSQIPTKLLKEELAMRKKRF
nr:13417_t:CDS:2 [Entrophospora candida]